MKLYKQLHCLPYYYVYVFLSHYCQSENNLNTFIIPNATCGGDSVRAGFHSACKIKFPYFPLIFPDPDQTPLT